MISNLKAIYEGDGVLRLLEPPPSLALNQEVQIDILTPEPDFDWDDIPRAPSAESIWRNMGLVEIDDPELARYIAFSLDIAEWNQPFNETFDESAA